MNKMKKCAKISSNHCMLSLNFTNDINFWVSNMKQSKVMQNADNCHPCHQTFHFWNIVQCLINSTVLPVPKDKSSEKIPGSYNCFRFRNNTRRRRYVPKNCQIIVVMTIQGAISTVSGLDIILEEQCREKC